MSIAVRKSLARQLNQLRIDAGKSVADVAATKIVSKTTLLAIEGAERAVKIGTLIALCQLYGAQKETSDRLVKMALHKEKGWWEDYFDVMSDPRFRMFIELESVASEIFSYDSELLYGLLQTPEYHRAIFHGEHRSDLQSVDREVQFRIDRQKAALGRNPPLQVNGILNEGVLVRVVGGHKVMDEQRQHLLSLHKQSNVQLNVLPWHAGAHAAMSGSFQVVTFKAPDNPDIAYLETSLGIRYVEDEARVAMFREIFDGVLAQTVPLEEYLR
jgi:transcriptional regulator with XRE-family HTH domain